MSAPFLSSLRKPPVVGKFYMVPAVHFVWCGIEAWWPVLGPLHTDREFFNFSSPHYHVDARFVRKDLAKRASDSMHRNGIAAQTQRSPLSRNRVPDAVDVPTGRPALRRMKCQMAEVPYLFAHQEAVIALRKHHGDGHSKQPAEPIKRADGRLLCPHRKVDLSTFEPDADGIVTCPLHGLRVRCGSAAA